MKDRLQKSGDRRDKATGEGRGPALRGRPMDIDHVNVPYRNLLVDFLLRVDRICTLEEIRGNGGGLWSGPRPSRPPEQAPLPPSLAPEPRPGHPRLRCRPGSVAGGVGARRVASVPNTSARTWKPSSRLRGLGGSVVTSRPSFGPRPLPARFRSIWGRASEGARRVAAPSTSSPCATEPL